VLQAFSRNYLGSFNLGDHAQINKTGGISQFQAKLGFRLTSSALENGFVRVKPASRQAV